MRIKASYLSHIMQEKDPSHSPEAAFINAAPQKNAFLRLVTLKPIKSEQSAAEEHHSEPTGE